MKVWATAGDTQTAATLDIMAAAARAAATQPSVVRLATDLVRHVIPENRVTHWQRVRAWLMEHTHYLTDPEGVPGTEVVRAPAYLLAEVRQFGAARGDCDDVATLGAALGLALGMRVRFVVVAFAGQPYYSHVYAELETPQGWGDLDVQRPRGGMLPAVTRSAVLEV